MNKRDAIMRNRAAHAYEGIDMSMLWKTAVSSVSELRIYCEGILEDIS